jgi:hypothetical protein
LKYFKRIRSENLRENIKLNMCRNRVWHTLWYFKAVTSYRGKRFQVPTCLTTVTRQTGEYKVDLTRHPKFPLAFGELASGRFPVNILLFVFLIQFPICNHFGSYFDNSIGGVMISMFASSVLVHGLEPWSGKTKDCKISICCHLVAWSVGNMEILYRISQTSFLTIHCAS